MEIPTRVDVADRDRELSSEFEAGSSLAENSPEPQFRRAERRVAVRRGALPKRTASRIRIAVIVVVAIGLAAAAYGTVYRYGTRSWRFRLNSSDDIAITGLNKVTRHQVMDVLGADIGRNVFFISLEQRRHQLEQIPWIESASVMRLLPNRLAVQIHERTPIAFVQVHNRIELVDANGIIMDLPRHTHYSFPVILGMSESVPMPQRAAQMKTYQRLVSDLDSGDAHYSKDVSEVNLSDPDDVKITVADPAGAVLVHLGNEQFLDRFKVYLSHAAEWRAQFQKLQSVDLRYDGQIIVNPDGDAPSSVSKRFATEARER